MPNELLKHGGQYHVQHLTKLAETIFDHHRISDEWRTSIAILMFKRGDKKLPKNYRGVILLNSTLKLITKTCTNKISRIISLPNEKQGFGTGRSWIDAVFVIRQINEECIEYNRSACRCYIERQKASHRIKLQYAVYLLYSRQVPYKLIKITGNIYNANKLHDRIDGELTA